MKNIHALLKLGITTLSSSTFLFSCSEAPKKEVLKPNIIYIFTDQQHADAMSNTGNSFLNTPGIDTIAKNGVRFEKAYCTWPLCSPSRASMITGKMPSEVKAKNNSFKLPEEGRQQEMGWVFKNGGYETAYAGKWHLPGQSMEEGHGFEILSGMDDELATQKSIEFIKREHTKPYLLVTSLWQPHGCCPYHRMPDPRKCENLGLDKYGMSSKGPEDDKFDWPENAYDESFLENCPTIPANFELTKNETTAISSTRTKAKDMKNKPKFWADYEEDNAARNWGEEEFRYYYWAYYKLVERLDGQVVRILDALKESGDWENTVIIFSSDHGDMMGGHRMIAKNVFYEEAIRIPFIISYPGNIPAGSVNTTHLVSNGLDLLPTMCDYAGIEPPVGLNGKSLRLVAEGKQTEPVHEDLMIEIRSGLAAGNLLHTGDYKYIKYDNGEEELYDMQKDPGEMNNLAGITEYESIKTELKNTLEQRLPN